MRLKSIAGKFALLWIVLYIALSLLFPNVNVSNRMFAVICVVLVIGAVLVVGGTIRKNRWGINLEQVDCPRCKQPMPQVRKPASVSQALWGGGTCQQCGCEVDKWGREIVSA